MVQKSQSGWALHCVGWKLLGAFEGESVHIMASPKGGKQVSIGENAGVVQNLDHFSVHRISLANFCIRWAWRGALRVTNGG